MIATTDPATIRRRAFTTIVVGFAAFLYLFSPLNLLVIGWFADFEDAISHRVHEVVFGAMFAMVFVGVVAQVRHPERNVAGFLQSTGVLAAFAIIVSASTGFEGPVLAYVLPPALLLAVHPDPGAVVRPAVRFHRGLALVGAGALVPMAVVAVEHFQKALDRVQGHESHWGAVTAFAIAVLVSSVIVTFRPAGWKAVARTTAGAVTAYAVVSLAFRFDASALDPVAAVVSLLWSAVLVAATFVVDRAAVSESPRRHRLGTRRPRQGIVAGVAVGIAHRTGIPVRRIRVGFVLLALFGVGALIYAVSWMIMPVEPGTHRGRPLYRPSAGGAIAGTVVLALTLGSSSGLNLVIILAVGSLATWVIVRRARSRPELDRGALSHQVVRGLFGIQVGFIGLVLVMMWSFGFGTPVVPHKVVQTSNTYCATCHVQELARGAPTIDLASHPYGGRVGACTTCHDHLPPSPEPTAHGSVQWPTPLGAPDAVLSAAELSRVRARSFGQSP